MTTREHLHSFHKRMSLHHAMASETHRKLSECHKAMCEKAMDEGAREANQEISARHHDLAQEHKALGEFHAECAAECQKLAGDDLGKAMPDRVLGVIPTNVPASGYRAIPRQGQPTPATSRDDLESFQHFLKVEGE